MLTATNEKVRVHPASSIVTVAVRDGAVKLDIAQRR
jgi:hypothetical protein